MRDEINYSQKKKNKQMNASEEIPTSVFMWSFAIKCLLDLQIKVSFWNRAVKKNVLMGPHHTSLSFYYLDHYNRNVYVNKFPQSLWSVWSLVAARFMGNSINECTTGVALIFIVEESPFLPSGAHDGTFCSAFSLSLLPLFYHTHTHTCTRHALYTSSSFLMSSLSWLLFYIFWLFI